MKIIKLREVKIFVLLGVIIIMFFSFVGCENNVEEYLGKFYSLQEAYDESLLTVQDLMSIAYYHGSLNGIDGTFVPTPKKPGELNERLANPIRQEFFKIYVEPYVDEHATVTIDDVIIAVYYGTYNRVVAVRMKDNFGSTGMVREIVVANVTFSYNSGNDIIVWKEN